MRRILSLVLSVLILAALMPTVTTAQAATDYSWIKVKLTTNNATAITMYVRGDYFIAENGAKFSGGTLTVRADGTDSVTLIHSELGEIYSGSSLSIRRANVERSAGYISLNSRYYLGHFNIRATSSGYIQVVNEVPLAHYLYGVVGYEMSDSFPIEALKSQAIAAKCYVLTRMNVNGEYYIGDTSADQVYKGYNSSYSNVIAAVDSTLTEVLTYNGAILSTYYAASNGGETNYPTYAWSGQGRPNGGYGVSIDDPDMANTWSNKEVVRIPMGNVQSSGNDSAIMAFLLLKAQATLNDSNVNYIDTIYSAQTSSPAFKGTTRNLTKATVKMRVFALDYDNNISAQYDDVEVSFKLAELYTYGVVSNASLRVYWGEYNNDKSMYYIYHARWGHGVGMSQRGAQQRASNGESYKQILNFYYPNASWATINVNSPTNPVNNSEMPTGEFVTAVTTGNVNFRKSADSSSKRICTIPTGTQVQVYSRANGWAYAVYDNHAGYISEDYLKYTAAAPTTAPGQIMSYGNVTGSGVKLRKGPGTNYGYIASLAKNTKVDVLGLIGSWYKVIANGTEGYISSSYIAITGYPTPTPDGGVISPDNTPTPTPDTGMPPVIGYGEVTGTGVNFRSGPAVSNLSFMKLQKGTKLSLFGTIGDWFYCMADGKIGYISGGYVKVTGNASPAPTVSPGTSPTPSATPGTSTQTGIITGVGVNFRSGPSTGAKSLGKLAKDTGLGMISTHGDWCYVLIGSQYGYVYKDYVKLTGISGGNTDGKGKGVTTGGVNLRNGPSTQYASLGILAKGTQLTITGSINGWYSVTTTAGKSGYVSGKYVSITQAPDGGGKPGAGESNQAIGTGMITATVNFREAPSTSSKKLSQFKKGVTVTLYSLKNGWYEVEYKGARGYLYAEYVKQTSTITPPPGTTPTASPTPVPGTTASPTVPPIVVGTVVPAQGKVISRVNFRSEPSTSSAVYRTLDTNTQLTVFGKCDEWYYVLHEGKTGFINKPYLTITGAGTTGVPEVSASSEMRMATTNIPMDVYSNANTNSAVMKSLESGVSVMMLYELNGWCFIKSDKTYGYVRLTMN
ncbi:MAG: SH3 domain-containing protein [Clostridia bacterium]